MGEEHWMIGFLILMAIYFIIVRGLMIACRKCSNSLSVFLLVQQH